MNKLPLPWDKRDGKVSPRNVIIGTGVLGGVAVVMGGIFARELMRRHPGQPNIVAAAWSEQGRLSLPASYVDVPHDHRRKVGRSIVALATPYSNFDTFIDKYGSHQPTIGVALRRGCDPWGIMDTGDDLQLYEPMPKEDPRLVVGVSADTRSLQAIVGAITPEQDFIGVDTEFAHRRVCMSIGSFVNRYNDAVIVVPPEQTLRN